MSGLKRQTLVRSHYPCDLYSGEDLSAQIHMLLKRLNPLKCKVVLLHDSSCTPFLIERISRFIMSSDYELIDVDAQNLSDGSIASFEGFKALVELLEENSCTADDIVVAVGSSEVLSVSNYTVRTYRKGIGYVAYPLDVKAAFDVGVSPCALEVAGSSCLTSEPMSDQVIMDWSYLDQDVSSHPDILARLFMGSLAAGDDLYRWLYEFSDKLNDAGNNAMSEDQSQRTLLWRTAFLMGLHEFAPVHNIDWGREVFNAFSSILEGEDEMVVIYETILFSLRLAVAHDKCELEFLREVEGFIQKLGYKSSVQVGLGPDDLYKAMRKSFFSSHNRMLLQVAVKVGVVHPILIKDEILRAHCSAWTKIHN